ncbi:hypothetical protein BBF93_03540 [Hyphomonas sp. CACIAM 19H1]|nr:hypothetical protein BBF93_03540 [Hyphomonas sp. CACIAM 19H1]
MSQKLINLLSGGQLRTLIIRLALRDLESRYRGSLFGLFWVIFTPMLMVATYAFVFTYIFQPRWVVEEGVDANFVLLLYSGILIHGAFSDVVGRAPGLILENVSYVKKVVFPLNILPMVTLVSALINLLIGTAILVAIYTVMYGLPPLTAVMLPVTFLPTLLYALGIAWLLSALGVYLRDLRHVVAVIISMLMFLSPIFYPIETLPAALQPILKASPLTPSLEASKDVLFWGVLPDPLFFGGSTVLSLLVCVAGFVAFNRLRRGFADVV